MLASAGAVSCYPSNNHLAHQVLAHKKMHYDLVYLPSASTASEKARMWRILTDLDPDEVALLNTKLRQKQAFYHRNRNCVEPLHHPRKNIFQVHECSRQFETDFQNSECGNPENYHSTIGSDADFVVRRQESYWHLLQSRIMRCVPRHMHLETALLQIFLGQAGLLIGSKRSHFQYFL